MVGSVSLRKVVPSSEQWFFYVIVVIHVDLECDSVMCSVYGFELKFGFICPHFTKRRSLSRRCPTICSHICVPKSRTPFAHDTPWSL